MFRIIKNLYAVVDSCIKINDEYSDFFTINTGVRQGCILSPILFTLFINGIAKKLNTYRHGIELHYSKQHKQLQDDHDNSDILCQLLFADDIVLLAKDANSLQGMINIIQEESIKWHFKINLDKTNIVIFNKKKHDNTNTIFKYMEQTLSTVNEYKYLGVNIENGLRWNEMKKRMLNKAQQAMIRSISMTKYADLLTVEAGMNIWNSLIRPNLEYGAEIWGDLTWEEAERLQLEVGRRILNVKSKSCDVFVRGELGWWTMKARRHEIQLRFLHRLLHMSDDRITKQIFLQSKQLAKQSVIDKRMKYSSNDLWYEKVKMIMNQYKIREEEMYLSNWKQIIKQKIHIHEEKQWLMNLNDEKQYRSKMNIYRTIKCKLEYEKYLKDERNKHGTNILSRLRSGSHFLRVETGRYDNIERENRICTFCNENEVDDEIHFLLKCEWHKNERELMWNEIQQKTNMNFKDNNISTEAKIRWLMACNNRCLELDIVHIVKRFLTRAVRQRGVSF
jgi:hypothetical protein